MLLHRIKKLLYSKGNNRGDSYEMREHLCHIFFQQKINIKNIKRAQKLKTKRKAVQSKDGLVN